MRGRRYFVPNMGETRLQRVFRLSNSTHVCRVSTRFLFFSTATSTLACVRARARPFFRASTSRRMTTATPFSRFPRDLS